MSIVASIILVPSDLSLCFLVLTICFTLVSVIDGRLRLRIDFCRLGDDSTVRKILLTPSLLHLCLAAVPRRDDSSDSSMTSSSPVIMFILRRRRLHEISPPPLLVMGLSPSFLVATGLSMLKGGESASFLSASFINTLSSTALGNKDSRVWRLFSNSSYASVSVISVSPSVQASKKTWSSSI